MVASNSKLLLNFRHGSKGYDKVASFVSLWLFFFATRLEVTNVCCNDRDHLDRKLMISWLGDEDATTPTTRYLKKQMNL